MLAVAALSARCLAEWAAADGTAAVALDCFGDVDTRRAAAAWLPIGDAQALRIDGDRLLSALDGLAHRAEIRGWVAGSGFESCIDVLEAGAARLPLIGTAPSDVRRLRDPRLFFAALQSLGIAHPPVRFEPPPGGAGWLRKNAHRSGGAHVRRDVLTKTAAGHYWQSERHGTPMSATFVGNGEDAAVIGFNRQRVYRIGDRAFVFGGVVGPVPISDGVQTQITAAARALTRFFRLRGLCSIDFIVDGDGADVLEVNARPPASAALYPRLGDGGPMRAHERACLRGELPAVPPPADGVRASMIVFAPMAYAIDARASACIAGWPGAHDIPAPGIRLRAGDPLCTLDACGHDADEVEAHLAQQHAALLRALEMQR